MKIFSVSEITCGIKALLEDNFCDLWIEGEISNFKPAGSGHFYFSLKDESAQLRAVMFRGSNGMLRFRPENGLHVLCSGRISVYEPRGEYQIIVEHMEPKGVGALQLAVEQLKKKLEAEGLFDADRKRPLPFLPQKIGIITSPTGAVIRDMIHVLTRRCCDVRVLINPVLVQGNAAAEEIASAIREFNERDDVDVIVVARGGGSMEDLWAFNEEAVARAIADSRVPIVSAVGHETDFTIADFVADVRAPTPSAAAEIVMPVKEDLVYAVDQCRHRLVQALQQKLENARLQLKQWEAYFRDPTRRLTEVRLRLDHCEQQMTGLMEHHLDGATQGLRSAQRHLESLNPLAILKRGYAVATRRGETKPLRGPQEAATGDEVDVRLHEGLLRTRVS